MSQFQILGRRPFPFKAISIRFAYTNISDTIGANACVVYEAEITDPDFFSKACTPLVNV